MKHRPRGDAQYIERELKKRAPRHITWVQDINHADFLIEPIIGPNEELDYHLSLNIPYAVLFYCGPSEGLSREYMNTIFKNATLTYSYLDLEGKGLEGKFILGPMGVDPAKFQCVNVGHRTFNTLTTGYMAESEGINSMVWANQQVGQRLIHVGGNLKVDFPQGVGSVSGVTHVENITDDELVAYYNDSRYVSGLRRDEGFELGVIEGLLCGARPICFDQPNYRRWFDNLAVFVPEVERGQLATELVGVFRGEYKPVTQAERDYVCEFFGWDRVARLFWDNLINGG